MVSRGYNVRRSAPRGADGSRIMIPAASSPRPSSMAEHSMPADWTPRNVLVSMRRSFSLEPGSAYGTRSPTLRFQAPVTTSVTDGPVVTVASWFLVDPGRGRRPWTSATPPFSMSTSCSRTRSTSLPARVSRSARVLTSPLTSTYSLSQFSEISMESELPQEAHVVLEEHAEVGHVVLEHRQPVEPGAERKARIVVRVDAAVTQHLRMDHAGAQDFQPAALAASAASAAAEATRDRGADARLGEREVVTNDPNAPFGTE